MTLFFYEMLVSRLFSIFLPAYFAYMVISFSILGLGVGGLLTYYMSANGEFPVEALTWAYIVSYVGTISLVFWAPFLGSAAVYVVLAMLPFVFGGALVSYIFLAQKDSFMASFADLAGALAGVAGAVLLMNYMGLPQAVVVAFGLTVLLSVIVTRNRLSLVSGLVLLVVLTDRKSVV